jgi:hypothetical protein
MWRLGFGLDFGIIDDPHQRPCRGVLEADPRQDLELARRRLLLAFRRSRRAPDDHDEVARQMHDNTFVIENLTRIIEKTWPAD